MALVNGNYLELIPRIPKAGSGLTLVGVFRWVDSRNFAFEPVGTLEGFLFTLFSSGQYAVRRLDGHIYELGRSVSREEWKGGFSAQ